EQHDPAAHRRADQDLRPLGQRVDDGERIIGPAPDRAVLEAAARGAMAAIVEADVGAARHPAAGLERARLGAGHVRPVAAEDHDAGAAPLAAAIGYGFRPPRQATLAPAAGPWGFGCGRCRRLGGGGRMWGRGWVERGHARPGQETARADSSTAWPSGKP